jgi:hypothetical protein
MRANTSNNHYPEAFYQKLGYLFYSISNADRRVSAEELNALQQIIREDWLSLDDVRDAYGSDTAYQIHIIFDFLREKEYSTETAYSVFSRYFKEHIALFTDDVIDRIFHSADRIAESLNGRNKSELQAIARLHLLLGKEKHIV